MWNYEIDTDGKATFIVTASFVNDSANAGKSYNFKVQSASARDENNKVTAINNIPTGIWRTVDLTNGGTLVVTPDATNEDNAKEKSILAGTSKKVFSVDVKATNEDVSVWEVIVNITATKLNESVKSAKLYLWDEVVATTTKISATDIKFQNLSNVVIPQTATELVLEIETNEMWYEKIWKVERDAIVTNIKLNDLEWVNTWKPVTAINQAIAATETSTFDIVPATVTATLGADSSETLSQIKFAIDKWNNKDAQWNNLNVYVTDLTAELISTNITDLSKLSVTLSNKDRWLGKYLGTTASTSACKARFGWNESDYVASEKRCMNAAATVSDFLITSTNDSFDILYSVDSSIDNPSYNVNLTNVKYITSFETTPVPATVTGLLAVSPVFENKMDALRIVSRSK